MNPFEEIIVVKFVGRLTSYSESYSNSRRGFLYRTNTKQTRRWQITKDVTQAHRFKSVRQAIHYARTLKISKRKIKQGFTWEVIKAYVPTTPPSDIIVASSQTDTPLHRLAREAE